MFSDIWESAMKFFGKFLSGLNVIDHMRRAVESIAIALVVLAALAASAAGQDLTAISGAQAAPVAATETLASSSGTLPTPTAAKAPARKPFRSARLTYLDGDVRVEHANSNANSVAVLNMPLVEGTVISSGADGQAEIEFEDGSLARLTPNSGLSLVSLSVDSSGNYQTRIALLGGLAYLELRGGTKYVYSVDVGGDVISPVENTTLRVNFDEAPASMAVLDGTAHFASSSRSFVEAAAGQTVQVDPSSEGGVLTVKSAIAPESWDRWNEDRDEMAENAAGTETDARTNFAGNQGYGWSDLDANGSWYNVPGHGEVWQPDVAQMAGDGGPVDDQGQDAGDGSGFDPYGYGNWAWTPAGYAWASGYGWGWLPYRCGLWSYYPGFGWGWSPDPYCGTYGFGGYGYGGYAYGGGINILIAPRIYRRPHRPIPGPGPFHPILRGPGHGSTMPLNPPHRAGGDRVIAGSSARRLPPVGTSFLPTGGGALGAGLRRDYAIDAETHTPVTGLVPATQAAGSASYARRLPPSDQENGPARGNYSPQVIYASPGQSGGGRSVQNEARPVPAQRQPAPSTPRASPPAPASHAEPAASKGK